MAFRSVTVASEAEVRLKAGQLVIVRDREITIPIDDIATLTLEHWRIRVSAAALAALSAAGVPVIVCDERHMPVGLLNGLCSHSRQFAVAKAQIAMTLPFKKRLWQTIVRSKLRNQAVSLDTLGLEGAHSLREYSSRVTSGDSTGGEATAARLYFSRFMPGERRHGGGQLDGALDYGYAVVRGLVCRLLVCHGLYPPLGIHHANEFNAFNLADDLLEPFRPFVDVLARTTEADMSGKDGRMIMAGILNRPCLVDEEAHSILTAADKVVTSFYIAMMERNRHRLLVPEFAPESSPDPDALQGS